ncbi:hypothetical protein CCUS01_10011 [Colletotrichum cuscutae]|uniref:Uncharacterized protein n=1 Tax=Colletotrichum cuscutae TaxID=1209917 RepID=A0AAI9UDX9_9PEZI|nr:hypothetical protein CCUS01_10011 [Colletotrichum cuscutae]
MHRSQIQESDSTLTPQIYDYRIRKPDPIQLQCFGTCVLFLPNETGRRPTRSPRARDVERRLRASLDLLRVGMGSKSLLASFSLFGDAWTQINRASAVRLRRSRRMFHSSDTPRENEGAHALRCANAQNPFLVARAQRTKTFLSKFAAAMSRLEAPTEV